MTSNRTILLVEDNPDDIELTLRAFEKSNLANDIVVVRDGAEALDYLFATGRHSGPDPSLAPQVVLLDLKLPKVSGLEVLKRIRGDERTRRLPVVILTSSKEERDVVMPGDSGPAVADWISRSRPDAKIIFMSGYTGDAIARQTTLDPGDNFLQKPFTAAQLVGALREALAQESGAGRG